MRVLVVILLFTNTCLAQLHIPEPIHDFGIIRENGEPVTHRFTIINGTKSLARIVSISRSCDCTVPSAQGTEIESGAESWLDLTYNPKGRPGYFLKSSELTFVIDGDTVRRNVALKGFTIDKDNPILKDETDQVSYSIRLAPFKASLKYADSWNLEQHSAFTNFMNDITFVIDQYKFAEIQMTLLLSDTSNASDYRAQSKEAKKLMRAELRRRNYPDFAIGFLADSIAALDGDGRVAAAVEITVPRFEDRNLDESRIIDLNAPDPGPGIEPPPGLSPRLIHYLDVEGKKAHKSPDYPNFLQRCVRNTLSHREIWLGATTFSNTQLKPKKVDKMVIRLTKDLVKTGIDESVIHVRNTETKDDDLAGVRLGEYLPPPDTSEKSTLIDSIEFFDLTAFQPGSADYVEVNDIPLQNLPAYFQMTRSFEERVDTSSKFFHNMMGTVIEKIKQGHKVSLAMESSASKVPSVHNVDNFYMARVRAEDSKRLIKQYMLDRGVKEEDIAFGEVIPIISGPEYDLRYYLPKYYYYFQYLKIIPLYGHEKMASNYIPPYKLNFTYNNLEVMNKSAIFQSFVHRVADHINKHGYIKLIIESSSSRIPSKRFGKNIHVAYHRAQEAKNKIYAEVKKRGINPSKVIISDERILVQGPQYKNDYKENAHVYERFQYVKIVPEQNLTKE